MKRILLFAIIVIPAFLLSMKQLKPRTILFFGDSITQQASNENGFLRVLQDGLNAKNDKSTQLINAGIGGNKVTDLFLRFNEDVLSKNPDEVIIWIGINDVWHSDRGVGTDLNKFSGFYQKMIDQLKARNVKVTLCTPGVIGELNDFSNPHDGMLNAFSKSIRKLAADNDCELIDFRKSFHEYEVKNNTENKRSGLLTTDGVHLNPQGNQFVAEIFKDALSL
jgi:lysophospholipase L1-like esterase